MVLLAGSLDNSSGLGFSCIEIYYRQEILECAGIND